MISLPATARRLRVPKGLTVLETSCATTCRTPACAAAARLLRPAGSASSAITPICRSRRSAKPLCSTGSDRRPAIRLACQLRPSTDLSFFQLFLRMRCRRTPVNPTPDRPERYLVSMFVDMRGSTKLAEKRLRSIPSSSSTAFSARCRRRCWRAAASRTSSSATACSRCLALPPAARGLPSGAQGVGWHRGQCRRIEPVPQS